MKPNSLCLAVGYREAKEAKELCDAAQVPLQTAIDFGDLPSLALKAWLLIGGREGIAKDQKRGFELAKEGSRLGCHDCQGILAECYRLGHEIPRDEAQSLELARDSSGKGSRYGQYVLGWLVRRGEGGVAQDYAQAVAFYRLAAEQGLDEAQCSLGWMYNFGDGVPPNFAEALRLYQLAAAQGHPVALYYVASIHEEGKGVPKNKAKAIYWYMRAQAAGYPYAAAALQRLRA